MITLTNHQRQRIDAVLRERGATVSDRTVMALAKVPASPGVARRRRHALGIDAYPGNARPRQTDYSGIDWSLSTPEIAKATGYRLGYIRKLRKRLAPETCRPAGRPRKAGFEAFTMTSSVVVDVPFADIIPFLAPLLTYDARDLTNKGAP